MLGFLRFENKTEITASMDAVYMKMMCKNPKDRYQTMREVIDALDELGVPFIDGGGCAITPIRPRGLIRAVSVLPLSPTILHLRTPKYSSPA